MESGGEDQEEAEEEEKEADPLTCPDHGDDVIMLSDEELVLPKKHCNQKTNPDVENEKEQQDSYVEEFQGPVFQESQDPVEYLPMESQDVHPPDTQEPEFKKMEEEMQSEEEKLEKTTKGTHKDGVELDVLGLLLHMERIRALPACMQCCEY